jgi:5-methylcytosine-specific restriction enzyme A
MKSAIGQCELCLRKDVETTVHHLTPREMGGTFMPTADLCKACHKQIHALYSNEELAARLSTIERLKDDPEIAKFLKWIKKQPSSRLPKVSKSARKKGN